MSSALRTPPLLCVDPKAVISGSPRNQSNACIKIMDDFSDFEAVFGSNSNLAYSRHTRDAILQNRQKLDHELFIDRLLKALSVRKGTLLDRRECCGGNLILPVSPPSITVLSSRVTSEFKKST